jgi:phage terminase large subunit-like protein
MDEYDFDTEIVQQSKQVMFNALRLCETEFQHHQINFNENEMDYWCLGNAAVETDDYANSQLVKQKGQPGKRIDGAVTYIILYEIYRRYRTEFLKNLK